VILIIIRMQLPARKSNTPISGPRSFSFQPIAVETLRLISESAVDFLRELGRRISSKFQEERQSAYLFQRLSVTVQRYNAVILHDRFAAGRLEIWPLME